jgi:hypothetical protein
MKRTCITFALAATMFGTAQASAEPNKEQYELQERCGRRAAEVFKNDHGGQGAAVIYTDTEHGQDIATYQNHYSGLLNKCFILEITTGVNYKENRKIPQP